MAGPGPAAKPDALRRRRNATDGTAKLQARGRKKAPPKWPLSDDVVMAVGKRMADQSAARLQTEFDACDDARSRRRLTRELSEALRSGCVLEAQIAAARKTESDLWRELWATPQATKWEALGYYREVAQYVRWKVRGETGDLDAAKEARQWSDRLGLTPKAMKMLGWEIDDAPATPTPRRRATTPAPRAARRGPDPRSFLRAV